MRPLLVAFLLALGLAASPSAQAFCGFYVSGADAQLYANATMVALLRDGTRTVLSMQNNYQGPPQDFAMVVPVPVVLQEDNVRTLPREIFQRLDQLAAPRLVEYWEQDPCAPPVLYELRTAGGKMAPPMAVSESSASLGVTVEAQFAVAEYDIVILSARDSGGLDTWLRANDYRIPAGAEPVLRPYVEAGTKFFVARVDVERVEFKDGQAVLSPLRVHYDSPDFSLPVRLGLLNSSGQQDLLVHILARGQRYEVANYDNATIPTNIRVMDGVREDFGGFYDKLFEQTVAGKPRTVVTEYSWDAASCDPCPVPALDQAEVLTLGGDVVGDSSPWAYTLTRLHYRYTAEHLGEDLVFQAAPPIIGGRGTPDPQGRLPEEGATPSSVNNFQGRYVILHPWDGEIACADPSRGLWGGPPGGGLTPPPRAAASALTSGPTAPRGGVALASLVDQDIPEIGLVRGAAPPAPAPPAAAPEPGQDPRDAMHEDEPQCAAAAGPAALLLTLPALLLARRLRR